VVDWVLHVRVEKRRGLRRHPQRERRETDLDHHERGGDDLEVLSLYHAVRRDDRGHRDQSAELRERLAREEGADHVRGRREEVGHHESVREVGHEIEREADDLDLGREGETVILKMSKLKQKRVMMAILEEMHHLMVRWATENQQRQNYQKENHNS